MTGDDDENLGKEGSIEDVLDLNLDDPDDDDHGQVMRRRKRKGMHARMKACRGASSTRTCTYMNTHGNTSHHTREHMC